MVFSVLSEDPFVDITPGIVTPMVCPVITEFNCVVAPDDSAKNSPLTARERAGGHLGNSPVSLSTFCHEYLKRQPKKILSECSLSLGLLKSPTPCDWTRSSIGKGDAHR